MTTRVLATLQASVDSAEQPAAKAIHLWTGRRSTRERRAAFDEVIAALREMGKGRERCMYCEDSAGTDIEHFRPKSAFPQFTFRWDNYLWACSHCNSNEKRTKFPIDTGGAPLLIDPTTDDPHEHMALVPETGQFHGVTAKGEASVETFGLNRRETLAAGRRDVWTHMTALIRDYSQCADDAKSRDRIRDAVRNLSFQSVVHHYLRDALEGRSSVPADVAATVAGSKSDWAWAIGQSTTNR